MRATLSAEHRRFLVVDEIVVPAIVNFAINAALAWLTLRGRATLPLWGASSIAVDTLVTAMVLPILTALVAAFLIRLRVARGTLSPLPPERLAPSRWSRRSAWVRGALLGAVAVVLLATPLVLVLALAGVDALGASRFIWLKASFATAVGLVVTPPLGWWALVDASRRHGT